MQLTIAFKWYKPAQNFPEIKKNKVYKKKEYVVFTKAGDLQYKHFEMTQHFGLKLTNDNFVNNYHDNCSR